MPPKNLTTDPITSADLKLYLATRDDFALELEVYRVAMARGFTASHGGTYMDPATGKPRQYDVRAQFERDGMRLALAIECKSLGRDYPLVISRVPRTDQESQLSYVCPVKRNETFMQHLPPAKAARVMKHEFYPAYQRVGRSMTQVGRTAKEGELIGGDPEVYDKWTQALASAADLIEGAVHQKQAVATAVLPILVVADATLWTADYDDEGRVQGDPVHADDCTFYVGRQYTFASGFGFSISHLHVCTRTGLKKFLYELTRQTDQWGTLFPKRRIGAVVFDKPELDTK